MRDPGNENLKAWAKEYDETAFCFEQDSEYGKRLVAWSEESQQTKKAFYAIVARLPETVAVLLKISVGKASEGKPLWQRYHATVSREHLLNVVKDNEVYVFSDGMHQLCVKDAETDRYLAFDDHGVLFLYSPTDMDAELFESFGFEKRYAEPIYSIPHFQHTPPDSEKLEAKFVNELGMDKVNSDLG